MDAPPIALALTLCDQIIVDERTSRPSLISVFSGLQADRFPTLPTQFSACVMLTGGAGSGIIELKAIQVATGEQIYAQSGRISFPDRTDIVNAFFRIESICFPNPGFYLFEVRIDGGLIQGAQRRIRVYRRRGIP